ncbi:MAG TPA: hypothetical protein VGB22_07175 [candidate division Zixibacteria bacterium]|jgi:hypothetical protein
MAYIDGVYKRLDEIIADPQVPYEEVRERMRQFVAEEIRKSFWNGVKSGSGRRPRTAKGETVSSDEVTVPKV